LNVLILGATSRIAQSIAAEHAKDGDSVLLAARDRDEVKTIASDIQVRHSTRVLIGDFEATDIDSHAGFIADAVEALGSIDTAYVVFGAMGEQAASQQDFSAARTVLDVNFTGAVSISEALASYMEERGEGVIVGISSVAGDRGRQSNYFYGAAKGGYSLYLQGLRGRLARSGVHVMTAKLGFIDTPMTYGMKTRIPIASPEATAKALKKAAAKGKNTLYYPWFWRFVMLLIKAIPERTFKKLKV
jgi:short-subunit dehydrogenase